MLAYHTEKLRTYLLSGLDPSIVQRLLRQVLVREPERYVTIVRENKKSRYGMTKPYRK